MRTEIHPDLADRQDVQRADAILRRCVHCGFCNATCPTYQELGEELDGPRGRIYLIKNMLEQNTIASDAVTHLDRCLTCRACETTCPSGVQYGELIDIGRGMADGQAERSWWRDLLAGCLRLVVPRRKLFGLLLRVGQVIRPVMPRALRTHVPPVAPVRHATDQLQTGDTKPKVLLLTGCVQSAATPNVVASVQKLLEAAGVNSSLVDEGCCGALDYHLAAHDAGKARMQRVIELLEPHLEEVDAILSSATGCGVTITEYDKIFQDDADWAVRAARVAAKVQDVVTYFQTLPQSDVNQAKAGAPRVAVHTPCSMQHGMKLVGQVETLLSKLGYEIVPHQEGHLCCGSAGTYSILQPDLSTRLRDRKLSQLQAGAPEVIVTANIGCQLHLGSGADVPVMHWVELLADELA